MKLSFLFESKKLRIFDFDDTIAKTSAKYKEKDGKPDFSDWEQVKDPKIIKPIFNTLKNILNKGDKGRKTVILTARGKANPVKNYMKSKGVNIQVIAKPKETSNAPKFKKSWIEKQIKLGYDDIEFFDDSKPNIDAVEDLRKKYPNIRLRTRLVRYKP